MITATLQILGCLGVFLFGMKVLSEGIQKSAGEGLRNIMATMTRNRFAGIGTGFITTCLLQSSSATTVIVVSFVNAGLLTLVESIGVIMGANLGTTITAWIIAAVGKFSLSKIALPIIGIGLPLIFIGKNRAKSVGEIFIGFGLLFFGLGLLKDAVPDVKSMLSSTDPAVVAQAEHWREIIAGLAGHGFMSILIFLFIGIVLTLIVQSSSAAMAITVIMAVNGWIGFNESCAIVLGENIGTTVTAWLASLGANTSAKRAARAHFLFNVLGTTWMLIAFYPFSKFVLFLGSQLPESFRSNHKTDIGFDLAIFHTTFNLANILLLIAFVPLIARLVTKWVKEEEEVPGERHRLKYISQRFVDVGELNLPEAEQAMHEMVDINKTMLESFIEMLDDPATNLGDRVKQAETLEEDTDLMMHDITDYLIRCSTDELSDSKATNITSMIRIVAECEEISDCEYRLIKLLERKVQKDHTLQPEVSAGLKECAQAANEIINFFGDRLFKPITAPELKEANKLEQAIDDFRDTLNKAALGRMQTGGDIKAEMVNVDICNQLEKIGNHALNIVETSHAMSHHSA